LIATKKDFCLRSSIYIYVSIPSILTCEWGSLCLSLLVFSHLLKKYYDLIGRFQSIISEGAEYSIRLLVVIKTLDYCVMKYGTRIFILIELKNDMVLSQGPWKTLEF
jgi:hypothetical protein